MAEAQATLFGLGLRTGRPGQEPSDTVPAGTSRRNDPGPGARAPGFVASQTPAASGPGTVGRAERDAASPSARRRRPPRSRPGPRPASDDQPRRTPPCTHANDDRRARRRPAGTEVDAGTRRSLFAGEAATTTGPTWRDRPSMAPWFATRTFTAEERARLAPHFTDLDGPVFALTDLPEVVKGALFARYSRSPKSLRRLFLDEFAEPLEAGRGRAGSSGVDVDTGREALRAGVPRVRRRLRRAARRRAPGVRGRLAAAGEGARTGPAGRLPRAVHPLHPVRRPSRARYRYVPPEVDGRPRRRGVPGVRSTTRSSAYARLARADAGLLPRALPAGPGRPRLRLPRDDHGEGAATRSAALLPAATRTNIGMYATGAGVRTAAAPDARPPARRGSRLRRSDARRAPQGDPGVPHARRRPGPRRRLDRLPRARRARPRPRSRRSSPRASSRAPRRRGDARRLGSATAR